MSSSPGYTIAFADDLVPFGFDEDKAESFIAGVLDDLGAGAFEGDTQPSAPVFELVRRAQAAGVISRDPRLLIDLYVTAHPGDTGFVLGVTLADSPGSFPAICEPHWRGFTAWDLESVLLPGADGRRDYLLHQITEWANDLVRGCQGLPPLTEPEAVE